MRRIPAATSQGDRPRSQKPSKRPAATQARSSAAAPKRRMPATSGMIAGKLLQVAGVVAVPLEGHAGRDHAIGEVLPRRHPEPPVVQEGAAAALGREELVGDRVVDQRRVQLSLPLERDRDGELRDAVQEVGGAVERVDDPAVLRIARRSSRPIPPSGSRSSAARAAAPPG